MSSVVMDERAGARVLEKRTNTRVYLVAALCSVLLTLWMVATSDAINPDGLCYLQSAEVMGQGLSAAMHLCGQAQWPFYSILIYGFAKWTSLSYLLSAYFLNGVFSLLSVLFFVRITAALTSSRRILWLAAAVILLPHHFNSLRPDIIRDHGFWAFYLGSLFFFLQYLRNRNKRWLYAAAWNISIVMATLFRIEGAIFLMLLPFAVWFDARESVVTRLKLFLQLSSLTFLVTASLLMYLILHPGQQMGRLGELQFQLTQGMSNLIHHFQSHADALGQHVLSEYSARDASLVLLVMLVGWYLISAAINISLVYAVLVCYAWRNKVATLDESARIALWGYVFINVLITAIFLADNLFLTKRYLTALSLVLMLWVPFALNSLMSQWGERKWPIILTGIFVAYYAIGGIVDFGYSKHYLRDASEWLAVNTPSHAKIYTNDYQILYYAGRGDAAIYAKNKELSTFDSIADGKWHQYDYLVLQLNQRKLNEYASLLRELHRDPVVIYKNTRDDQVRIYQLHDSV